MKLLTLAKYFFISLFLYSIQVHAFTYQGELTQVNSPVDATVDFEFTLYNADIGGSIIGTLDAHDTVDVSHGRFAVDLNNWPSVYDGSSLWLEIAVDIDGDGTFTLLTPRQKINPAPYSEYAYDIDETLFQRRVTGSCPSGRAVRSIDPDGTVICNKTGDGHSLDDPDGFHVNALVVNFEGKVGIGTPTPEAGLDLRNEDGVLFRGVFESGSIPTEGPGERFMWYQEKYALRAGKVTGTTWDDTNTGVGSAAFGLDNMASGDYSVSAGKSNQATGHYATSMGTETSASGIASTALGYLTEASGNTSTAMGSHSIASGSLSTSTGLYTRARSYVETSVGMYSTDYTPASESTWSATDRIFVVGNGTTDIARSDALAILKNGDVVIGKPSPDARLEVYKDFQSSSPTTSDQLLRLRANFVGTTDYRFIKGIHGTAEQFYISGAGHGWFKAGASGPSWTNTSSRIYKEDIKKVDSMTQQNMLEQLMQMELTTYKYKEEHGGDGKIKLGFIAEEMPKQVTSSDGKGIDLYELLAYTIGAMQIQENKIQTQEKQIAIQIAENKELKMLICLDHAESALCEK